MALVSRLAENLNSNICDGYGQRQQMDVWFCVPPQEPKTKAPGKELQKHTSPRALRARHEDPPFPLTLLIMAVRPSGYTTKWIATGLKRLLGTARPTIA